MCVCVRVCVFLHVCVIFYNCGEHNVTKANDHCCYQDDYVGLL